MTQLFAWQVHCTPDPYGLGPQFCGANSHSSFMVVVEPGPEQPEAGG